VHRDQVAELAQQLRALGGGLPPTRERRLRGCNGGVDLLLPAARHLGQTSCVAGFTVSK
jgi:hypothetical protein